MRGNESIAPARESQLEAPSPVEWRTVDRALRAIAAKRAGLDAEELCLLREAEALQIWRPLGMVSALDYLERVFGYTPRVAEERLRVARALGELPRLSAELAAGQLPFTAVRELTRVITPATEAAWIDAARSKNVREIEDLVSGHRRGDRPDEPANPDVRRHVVRFELEAATFAQLRQARQVLDDESGRRLSDDELVAALCGAVLEGAPAAEPTGRGRFQIAVTVCERCQQGWQAAAGAAIPIDDASVERALCDAQHIGSLDGDGPERAYQDISPSVVRFVWRRDGGRCRVPGCRSSRALEIHHIVHRADGGGHDPSNLALLCSSCHMAHHRGALVISGTANRLVVRRPHDNPHVGAPHAVRCADERQPRGTAPATRNADVEAIAATVSCNGRAAASRAAAECRNTHVPARHQERPANHEGNGAASLEPPASTLDAAVLRVQGKQALVGLGWKPAIAEPAVSAALAALEPAVRVEQLIAEALRRCQRPSSVVPDRLRGGSGGISPGASSDSAGWPSK